MDFNKCVVFFVVAFCVIARSISFEIKMSDSLQNQQKVVERLVRQFISQQFAKISPADINANECFADYNIKQTAIINQYNEKFNVCLETAEDARDQLAQESEKKREETLARGKSICEELSSCEVFTDGREFFQCYSRASSNNYQPLYQISTDTGKEFTLLNIQYQKIDSDEKICSDDAFNEYLVGLAEANSELQDCLNGVVAPTTTIRYT